jgi:hypothetical protein
MTVVMGRWLISRLQAWCWQTPEAFARLLLQAEKWPMSAVSQERTSGWWGLSVCSIRLAVVGEKKSVATS